MALALRFAARSDVGLLRNENEDSGYAGPRLLVIADGMGGHAAGEVASSVAVATLAPLDEDSPGGDLLDRLERSVHDANDRLRFMVGSDPSLGGMGTTLTALLRAGRRLGLVHVGDSRCYLLRDGELQQITHDHTFVQTLVDEGRITAAEADHHPQRSLILRALDGRGDIELDLSLREVSDGDRYLLCSDGLSSVVSEDTLRDTLREVSDPAAACEALVSLALRGGGPDNITCIVADVVDVDQSPSAVPEVVGAAAGERVGGSPHRPGRNFAAARAAALATTPGGRGGNASPAGAAAVGTLSRSGRPDDGPDGAGERPPRRRHWLRWTLLIVVLALLIGGSWAAWTWSQGQYYVGADGENVAIYQGLSQGVGGLSLSHVQQTEDLLLSQLPPYSRERVRRAIPARDLDDARAIVGRLYDEAAACAARQQAQNPPPQVQPAGPTLAPGTTPTPTPIPTPIPTPTPTPTPRPTPTECTGGG